MTASAEPRAMVVARSLAFSAVYVSSIVLLHRLYLARTVRSRELAAALAIAFVQCAAIVTMLSFSFCSKLWRQIRASRGAHVRPYIRELLAMHAAGNDRRDEIRRLWLTENREIESCLVEFLSMVRGSGRETLSELAAGLDLIGKWQAEYRSRNINRRRHAGARLALASREFAAKTLRTALADADESVRLHTARAMLQNCHPGEAADVFRLAVSGSLVTRAILTEDLRPYALELSHDAILAELFSADVSRIVAVLEMLRAWGKFLPLPQVYALVRHPDRRVRAAALRVLPEVPRLRHFEAEILHALRDPLEEVRSAAAVAAARMRVEAALPALAQSLHEDRPQMAAAAAWALAQFGREGCQVLEQETFTGSPLAASVALEALERVHVSSYEMASQG